MGKEKEKEPEVKIPTPPESLKDVIDDVLDLSPSPEEIERTKDKKELEEFLKSPNKSKVFLGSSNRENNEAAPFLLKKSKGQ